MFATHFFEITNLAKDVKCVENVFCDALATKDKFTLLYNIKPGISKKSFGINVANLAGFPPEVVANAEAAMVDEDDVIDSIDEEALKKMKDFIQEYKRKLCDDVKADAQQFYKKIKLTAA